MKASLPRSFVQPFVQLAALALALMGCLPLASAQGGYDLFQTGSGASVDLSSINLGVVSLQGVPLGIQSIGNTDTIIHRTADIPTGGGTVPVTMFVLSMKSISSVTFQGQPADVYVTVNNSQGAISTTVVPQPDQLSPSTGTLTVNTNGTFDSSITVTADVIIVKAGTSAANSANYLAHQGAASVTLTSTASTWSASGPSGYPVSTQFPSGGFRPIIVNHDRRHHPIIPASCGGTGQSGIRQSASAVPVQTCVAVAQ